MDLESGSIGFVIDDEGGFTKLLHKLSAREGKKIAQLLVHLVGRCGDDLTREHVMKQASSLKDVPGDLTLPGIAINTSPTDYRVRKQLQMMKFNGEHWEVFGPILEDAGPG